MVQENYISRIMKHVGMFHIQSKPEATKMRDFNCLLRKIKHELKKVFELSVRRKL